MHPEKQRHHRRIRYGTLLQMGSKVHRDIQAYVKTQNLKPTLTVEEYTAMGMDKSDPKDWETNVFYLYE